MISSFFQTLKMTQKFAQCTCDLIQSRQNQVKHTINEQRWSMRAREKREESKWERGGKRAEYVGVKEWGKPLKPLKPTNQRQTNWVIIALRTPKRK